MTALRTFDKGLYLGPPQDTLVEGFLRRARGLHTLSEKSARSRDGSGLLAALDAHSITYFNDYWYYGVLTSLYRGLSAVKTGLSGDRLSFVSMPPVAGITDYLFVAGGGDLFKVSRANAVTDWGFAAPLTGLTAAASTPGYTSIVTAGHKWTLSPASIDATFTSIRNATYRWIASGSGTNEYYCELSAGGNPSLVPPAAVRENGGIMVEGTLGSLAAGEWAYGDNDTLGFSTIYVRLSDGTDPDTKAVDYVDYTLDDITTAEYYCTTSAGGDPSIAQPTNVRENAVSMETGSLGELNAGEWAYGDNDALGFNTVYVRLSDSTDPDTHAVGYVGYTTSAILPADGVYQYKVTYRNSVTGHRSNAYATAASATVDHQRVQISTIPNGAAVDAQIDQAEIWRTVADGSVFFLLKQLAAGVATYLDDGSDSILSLELPTDNLLPYAYFDECIYHNASAFWITRSEAGQRGRVFYSPIGRCESVQGYIDVCGDDTPLQRLVAWKENLGVVSTAGVYKIVGSNPYTARKVEGVPGTTKPWTVVSTVLGVLYEADDGVRLFDGDRSQLVTPAQIQRIFRGEAVENLTAFSGLVAAEFRGEYIISDGTQSLAFDPAKSRWRDLGVGCTALHFANDVKIAAATIGGNVLEFEREGALTDAGTAISYEIEPMHLRLHDEREALLLHVNIDINTNGQQITATLILDSVELDLGPVNTAARELVTLNVGRFARIVGLRLTGSLTNRVELFSVEPIVYVPGGGQ